MHQDLAFQGANMLYMYMPLEEALQNKAMGMNLSVHVDSDYQF